MKIGILTHPIIMNYGGILQAFALQKVLLNMGHDVITIDRKNVSVKRGFFYMLCYFVKRNFDVYFRNRNKSTCWNPFISEEEMIYISQHTRKFVERNIRKTECVCTGELESLDKKYKFDAYVVGSDQIWNIDFCPDSFLDFVKRKNVVKITYAASCGKKNFSHIKKLRNKCKILAQDFKAFSVREKRLIQLCNDELGREAEFVLDPTLLLSPQDYLSAITEEKRESFPFIFTYILDPTPDKTEIICEVARKMKLPEEKGNIACPFIKGKHKIEDCVYSSVDSWLNKLYQSQFVITDSFHGMVFSIIFQKQFIVIGNRARGYERFLSLLSELKLENRLYSSNLENILNQIIDYELVNKKLLKLKEASFAYLKRNLNGEI